MWKKSTLLFLCGIVFFSVTQTSAQAQPSMHKNIFLPPLQNAIKRITKKPFGIKISPNHSPVTPERFKGYHTGVDFEVMDNEKNSDVRVFAICTGPLVLKKWATGYGGIAVQRCTLDSQNITVLYGHIRLSSITYSISQMIDRGQRIGVLGKGLSTETDGERKHLHLGIHKGNVVIISGYVQDKSQLSQWIDIAPYLAK